MAAFQVLLCLVFCVCEFWRIASKQGWWKQIRKTSRLQSNSLMKLNSKLVRPISCFSWPAATRLSPTTTSRSKFIGLVHEKKQKLPLNSTTMSWRSGEICSSWLKAGFYSSSTSFHSLDILSSPSFWTFRRLILPELWEETKRTPTTFWSRKTPVRLIQEAYISSKKTFVKNELLFKRLLHWLTG